MKIWILGSHGMLGSEIEKRCKQKQLSYYATCKEQADISSLASLEKIAYEIEPTHIINCAAFTDVDGAEQHPDIAFQVNAKGPEFLGRIAKHLSSHVIHLSTDYVFSGETDIPYEESASPDPQSIYGRTKWEGECRLLDQLPTACIIRTSWIYGVNGKNFFSKSLSLLQQSSSLKIVSDQVGRLTFLKDLSEAVLNLLPYQSLFHFANEGALSRYDMMLELKQQAEQKGIPIACKELFSVALQEFPALAKRPRFSILDTKKYERIFGERPRNWKETIKEFLEYAK